MKHTHFLSISTFSVDHFDNFFFVLADFLFRGFRWSFLTHKNPSKRIAAGTIFCISCELSLSMDQVGWFYLCRNNTFERSEKKVRDESTITCVFMKLLFAQLNFSRCLAMKILHCWFWNISKGAYVVFRVSSEYWLLASQITGMVTSTFSYMPWTTK